jgi:hypothetical protein
MKIIQAGVIIAMFVVCVTDASLAQDAMRKDPAQAM